MTPLIIICVYLGILVSVALLSTRLLKRTASDYFMASHSIGPVLLLMSVFGTTMTAFALVGSTGEAYNAGIGVYGMMASWSGLIHAAVFFLIGIKMWAFGKRYGYMTQIQFFRDRFESNFLGLLLFPILVGLVIPYLLMGLLGAGGVIRSITSGAFPELFTHANPALNGGIPPWLTGLVISLVVLVYIFAGGVRGAAWANTFQTIVFMIMGVVAFFLISNKLGGAAAATQAVMDAHPEKLIRGDKITQLHFLTYCFVPLSVGMFPHLFQHWLTAKSAKTFKLTVIAHPIFIMIVWVPCVLIGVWATSAMMPGTENLVVPVKHPPNTQLAIIVQKLTNPVLAGFLSAGILAAIMSSLDSQFFCLGTMFTNDIVVHYSEKDRFSDEKKILIGRIFIIAIVALTYLLSLIMKPAVFTLGVWCFSGFAALFPLVFASVYWKRTSKVGAIACVVTTAVVWLILFALGDFGQNRHFLFLGMMPVATIFAASTVALVVGSLVSQPPSDATLQKFFRQA